MMHIDFKAPELSQNQTARAQKLVEQMREAISVMREWTRKPGNLYKVLTKNDRKLLRDRGLPELLAANATVFTEQVRRLVGDNYVDSDEVMVGFTSEAFDSSLYSNPEIRRAIVQSHAGRCAYCETLLTQSAYGDVEHFRPKAAYTAYSPALFRPGYYELAYDPRNLFLSCQLCNESYKQNHFPVIGKRAPEVTLDQEIPVLINPYAEDPRECIRFNPVNGWAYAFDLAKAFYASANNWGPQAVEQAIWKDPTLIPGQADANGSPLSNPEVDARFQTWLAAQKTEAIAVLRRGTQTISILNLNRRPLVRARIDQLRQLRSIAVTSGTQNSDQQAAQNLARELLGTDPGRALLAPQYLSLTIDALSTLNSNPQVGSIEYYTRALVALAAEKKADEPVPPYNDALMYLVLDNETKLAGKRRIVYLTDADKVYGDSGRSQGVFLAIDWGQELDNTVEIIRNKQSQFTTLRELVSAPSQGLWRRFKDSQVWAIGEYLPIA
jgi:uncharacterized protein (TIGR02646 family)